ncbi:Endonuclease-reverse transcriptase, partial [Operophtera brumata]
MAIAMEEVLKAIHGLGQQLKETEDRLITKLDKINEKLCDYKMELDELRNSHEKQEKQLDQLEKVVRKCNLVFFGVKEQEELYVELESIIIKIINEKLDFKCVRNEIQHRKEIPRPIILGLTTFGKKLQILKNKNKLEGTEIYIKEDFPPKVLIQRKNLQDQLKTEIDGGKKAFIRYNKLIVLDIPTKNDNYECNTRNQKRALSDEISPNSIMQENRRNIKKNRTTRSSENRNITQYLMPHSKKSKE